MHRFNKSFSDVHCGKFQFAQCGLPKRLEAASGYKPAGMPGRKLAPHEGKDVGPPKDCIAMRMCDG